MSSATGVLALERLVRVPDEPKLLWTAGLGLRFSAGKVKIYDECKCAESESFVSVKYQAILRFKLQMVYNVSYELFVILTIRQ